MRKGDWPRVLDERSHHYLTHDSLEQVDDLGQQGDEVRRRRYGIVVL